MHKDRLKQAHAAMQRLMPWEATGRAWDRAPARLKRIANRRHRIIASVYERKYMEAAGIQKIIDMIGL